MHYRFLIINMLNILANSLVIAGACVLTGALVPVRQLIAQLPAGHLRRRWYALATLIFIFIAGYTNYTATNWDQHRTWADLIVPGVFFFGATFVWVTASLSLKTAVDVRQMTLLEYENVTDPLMGIYNRRYLDRRLNEEFARSRRYGLPLSVLLLDIDHFKQVNDMYGHPAGDLVLNHLGNVLLHAIRDSDIAARYGGEEVVVIAPNTDVSTAVELAERLRRHIEIQELVLSGQLNKRKKIHVTVSIGVADLRPEDADIRRLIFKADEALYRAKQEGRNRVVVHDAGLPKTTTPPIGRSAPSSEKKQHVSV